MRHSHKHLGPWWPSDLTPPYKRVVGAFRATPTVTYQMLEAEWRHIKAVDPVLLTGFDYFQIRRDNWPYIGQRPMHPGVVVQIKKSDRGPLEFYTDKFTSWSDNLRAIALGMEALRMLERHGITHGNQQYAGFRELAAPDRVKWDRASALRRLGGLAGWPNPPFDAFTIEQAYRKAAKRYHPDKPFGDKEIFQELQEIREVLYR